MDNQQNNNYDFILNQSGNKKPALFKIGSSKQRLFLGFIFVATVLLIFVVTIVMIFGNKPSPTSIYYAAAYQEDVLDICQLGSKENLDAKLANTLVSVATVITSQKISMQSMQNKSDPGYKKISSYRDKDYGQALESAKQNSTLNTVYQKILKDKLTQYGTTLSSASEESRSTKDRPILNDFIKEVDSLVGEL